MQMQHIRYFLALCEELNFTRAARRCGVTQPSLTNAVGQLERELGGPLFHRRPQIGLTALGRAVWPYLKEIEQTEQAARAAARSILLEAPGAGQTAAGAHRAREPVA
jgi:LysR family transcriptional regulator, hydrogen peroxide-inducible genes activator